jgi:F0F1-type ATP synthase membrane subunit b/b'
MHIDWWTLALQTANVLILIWLLARFLFRPVMEIMARRQDEANRLLADAAEARRQADETRADTERAHASIVADHNKMIAAAHAVAETERTALLARTNDEMTKLRADADADAAIFRDRLAMEKMLIERVPRGDRRYRTARPSHGRPQQLEKRPRTHPRGAEPWRRTRKTVLMTGWQRRGSASIRRRCCRPQNRSAASSGLRTTKPFPSRKQWHSPYQAVIAVRPIRRKNGEELLKAVKGSIAELMQRSSPGTC